MATFDVVPFHNYTEVNFTFTWDKESYLIERKETKYLPPFIAVHAAKHLVDREIIRAGRIQLLNDEDERKRLMAKILGSLVDTTKKVVENEKSEDKIEVKEEVEEEFPDLKNLNPAGFKEENKPMSRKEMFKKVKQLGLKIRATASNDELKSIIAGA